MMKYWRFSGLNVWVGDEINVDVLDGTQELHSTRYLTSVFHRLLKTNYIKKSKCFE